MPNKKDPCDHNTKDDETPYLAVLIIGMPILFLVIAIIVLLLYIAENAFKTKVYDDTKHSACCWSFYEATTIASTLVLAILKLCVFFLKYSS